MQGKRRKETYMEILLHPVCSLKSYSNERGVRLNAGDWNSILVSPMCVRPLAPWATFYCLPTYTNMELDLK